MSFVPLNVPDSPRLSLLCLPWAGAGASPFRAWTKLLPADVALYGVRLPGRETRILEPAVSDVLNLVVGLTEELERQPGGDVAVFGHCSGAVIGFELSRAIRRTPGRTLRHLFVASQHSPRKPASKDALPADLRGRLIDLGMDPALVHNDEFFTLIRPAIAADALASLRYVYVPGPQLSVPITALVGSRDNMLAKVDDWKLETSAAFRTIVIEGDHMFTGSAWERLGKAVAAELDLDDVE